MATKKNAPRYNKKGRKKYDKNEGYIHKVNHGLTMMDCLSDNSSVVASGEGGEVGPTGHFPCPS